MTRIAALATLLLVSVGCQASDPPPDRAPDEVALSATDTDGKAQDIDALLEQGETVALVFWQTWCESCKDEAPTIQAAAKSEVGQIHFVGVIPGKTGTVNEEEVAQTRKAWGYEFPQVRDSDMTWTHALGVKGTPTIVVLGKGRKVLYHEHRPPSDWSKFVEVKQDESGAPAKPECKDGVCPLPGGFDNP
jgi:thiol-disulfide isomerase/thioredoxin